MPRHRARSAPCRPGRAAGQRPRRAGQPRWPSAVSDGQRRCQDGSAYSVAWRQGLWLCMAAGEQPRYAYPHRASGEVPVTTGPQDPAAAGHDRLWAGHADREQVIGTLKNAFVHGRLTKDELDARTGQALAARTHAGLAALTADIPPGPAVAGPGRPPAPARRRPLARAAVKSGICLFIAAAAIGAGMLFPVDSGGPGPNPWAWPDNSPSGLRHMDGGRHHGVRGAGLMGAEVLPRAAAAPARAGRPGPRSRTIRRHRPWPGSPRLPHRPDPRRPAGPQVTAAPAPHSRPSGPGTSWHQAGARRGMTPMKPVPGPVPPRLPGPGFTS